MFLLDGDYCLYVDLIKIGMFFVVDFDVYEVFIEICGNWFVFEVFMFYYMILMICGVVDW